jgi:hypothetical protein
MVQMHNGTKYFVRAGGASPGTVMVKTDNSKDKVISADASFPDSQLPFLG